MTEILAQMSALTTRNNDNDTSNSCQFLYSDIFLFYGKFNTRVFDKRHDFSFPYRQFSFFGL